MQLMEQGFQAKHCSCLQWNWVLKFAAKLVLTGTMFLFVNNAAVAQRRPVADDTLGNERSIVTPDPTNPLSDRIEGGATRGENLFHSFQDFGVDEGRSVYFSNPAGIRNILSRVTGSNVSEILGVLGVLGDANLFLLNPNGIIFGPNAQLDVRGSFLASTGDRLSFADGSEFSAVNPQAAPLLTVNITPGLQYGTGRGDLSNAANLAVGAGQGLTLHGGTVTSTGILTAPGGRVEVLGDRVALLDNAQIDVSGEMGGGTVLIGGDYQGQGTVPNALRTYVAPGVTISADALSSGNGGRVIVWADETTGFYGNVNARGGSIAGNGGFVEISGAKNLAFNGAVNVGSLSGIAGTVLFDPRDINIVDGNASNNGVLNNDEILNDAMILFGDSSENDDFQITNFALGDITAGTIILQASRNINFGSSSAPVQVLLFQENVGLTAEAGGNIIVNNFIAQNGNNLAILTNRGTINLHANSDLVVNGGISSRGADISLRGNRITITSTPGVTVPVIQTTSETGIASGNLTINARELRILNGAQVLVTTPNAEKAGDITIENTDLVEVAGTGIGSNGNLVSSMLSVQVGEGEAARGAGGDLTIDTRVLRISNGGLVTASTFSSGNAGNIRIENADLVEVTGLATDSNGSFLTNSDGERISSILSVQVDDREAATGTGGELIIDARTLRISNGGLVTASTFSGGNAGSIRIENADLVEVSGENSILRSQVEQRERAKGAGGDLTIDTRVLRISNGGSVTASTFSSGNAGNIEIRAADQIDLSSNGRVSAQSTGSGRAGNLVMQTNSLFIQSGASATVSSTESVNAGNLTVNARNINLNHGTLTATTEAGIGGNIDLNIAETLSLNNNSQISAATQSGSGGNITIQGLDTLHVLNSLISAESATGQAGNIAINANNLEVRGVSSRVAAEATREGGSAGNLTVDARQVTVADDASISASNISSRTPGTGNIRLEGLDNLVVASGGEITTSTRTGRAGAIGINENAAAAIDENDSVVVRNGGRIAVSATGNFGEAGDLIIRTNQLLLDNGELSGSATSGRAGGIEIGANDSVVIRSDGRIVVEANRDGGTAGGITIRTDQLRLNNSSEISVAATGNEGTAGGITIRTDQLRLNNSSEISVAATGNEGTAGAITVNARRAMLQNNSAITAETTSGRGGRIVLRRRTPNGQTVNMDSLQVFNSRISAQTADGQAGSLIIRANRVRIDDDNVAHDNNASLRRQLRAQGVLSVEATESGGSAGNLTLNARQVTVEDGARISASNESSDGSNTGNVRLRGLETLVVNSSGEISASTSRGNAGSVIINADESVDIEESSRLAVEANGEGGTAGDLSISTDDLSIRNGSEATVNSRGVAGTLTIGADSIELDDGEITAIAGTSNLGNINLDMKGTLLQLDNHSLISAGAEAEGSGGDLIINAENGFVLANPYGNSDVLANASEGAGGDIGITTNAIWGLQERNPRTDLSDINAASEFSTGGSIALNTLNIDPTQGLTALPENVAPPNQIDQRCATGGGAGEQGEFVVSGRGGLPPNAEESLGSDAVQVDLVMAENDETASNPPASLPEIDTADGAIVEAQGWVVDANGNVVLTAAVPTATPIHSQSTLSCPLQQSVEQE